MKINKSVRRAMVPTILSISAAMLTGQFGLRQAAAQDFGINLPPAYYDTNGQPDSGNAAFQPGIYNWPYSNAQVASTATHFNMIRFPINEATANDSASLTKLKGYIDQIPGHWAIICMCGTRCYCSQDVNGHGNGFPNGLAAMGAAWKNINAVFASYPNVYYEIFNEPFGYEHSTAAECAHYVSDMKTIISDGSLPTSKCILDGLGYADDIIDVANNGWSGMLGYHFYPNWSSTHTQSAYSNLAQGAIGSLGPRTFVTEFGANLGWTPTYGYNDPTGCYDTYVDGNQPCSADVNCLRGLDDALRALKSKGWGVKGAFCWHGWDDGDTYDFWASWNSYGACKVMEIETND